MECKNKNIKNCSKIRNKVSVNVKNAATSVIYLCNVKMFFCFLFDVLKLYNLAFIEGQKSYKRFFSEYFSGKHCLSDFLYECAQLICCCNNRYFAEDSKSIFKTI